MSEQTCAEPILKLGLGFWASKALLSAVELGLFTALAAGPKTEPELREQIGIHPRAARDFFDALVSIGMLRREEGRYANTPETDLFLDRNKPSYVGGLLEMANARLYSAWGSLTEALRTGEPQGEAKGAEDHFRVLYSDPQRLRMFLQAMTGVSLGPAQVLARRFPWQRYQSFVDVGCAQGGATAEIARAQPHIQGVGFDLPEVQPIFEEYVARAGLADRLRFQPGNFFTDPLPRADVLLMGHILHGVDLERKRMLLAKALEALPDGGALILHEKLIDDDRRQNTLGLLMSLNMLIETNGGFDYTGADATRAFTPAPPGRRRWRPPRVPALWWRTASVAPCRPSLSAAWFPEQRSRSPRSMGRPAAGWPPARPTSSRPPS